MRDLCIPSLRANVSEDARLFFVQFSNQPHCHCVSSGRHRSNIFLLMYFCWLFCIFYLKWKAFSMSDTSLVWHRLENSHICVRKDCLLCRAQRLNQRYHLFLFNPKQHSAIKPSHTFQISSTLSTMLDLTWSYSFQSNRQSVLAWFPREQWVSGVCVICSENTLCQVFFPSIHKSPEWTAD